MKYIQWSKQQTIVQPMIATFKQNMDGLQVFFGSFLSWYFSLLFYHRWTKSASESSFVSWGWSGVNMKGENKFAANKTEYKDQTKNIIEIQTCKVDLNDVFMCYRD